MASPLLKVTADAVAAMVVTLGAPLFRAVGNWPANFPRYLKQADKAGVQWRSTHYYHPTYRDADLPADVTQPRDLPGVDLNTAAQRDLLASFAFQDELAQLTAPEAGRPAFRYDAGGYGSGDADALYAMLRHLKPARMIEVGSGNSTLVAARALARNAVDGQACEHICIEPYEKPWLESVGAKVIREKVESLGVGFFDQLQAGDVLFIDSSHVIRPFGDVLTLYQAVIPRLAKGVIVHAHDIFTPFDYPETWLRAERRLWNEQYLLEAMIAHSPRYRVLLAMHWLACHHAPLLARAFPSRDVEDYWSNSAFWFEVVE